jgi:hypothetical protein
MKKIIIALACVTLTMTACKKELGTPIKEEPVQQRSFCAMEEAMAKMAPELKDALMNMPLMENQASEILIYLDFDGALVRRGNANPTGTFSPIISAGVINCPPPALSAQQIEQIVDEVKDEFSPFNIVVTTDQLVFDTYPASFKQICIVTTLPGVAGFSSGVAGVSPFAFPVGTRLPFNPCFVFANVFGGDVHTVAGVISHEVGHTFGLEHQHHFNESCSKINEYHPGSGSGPLAFVPIMGEAAPERINNWFAQPCLTGNPPIALNDFELLLSEVILKEDDFPDSPGGSTQTGDINGILEQAGDIDFISINFKNPGAVTITSENIDLKVSLYNNGGHLLAVYNDPDDTHVTIPSVNGKRYLKVEAASNPNMDAQFMTGKYKVVY